MSTESQIQANRENAKLSSGPKTEIGKAVSALNNTRHGLTGAFHVLGSESQSDFDALLAAFREEHQPEPSPKPRSSKPWRSITGSAAAL